MTTPSDIEITAKLDATQVESKLRDLQAQTTELTATLNPKPGVKTSEFALTVLAILLAASSKKLGLDAEIVWGILGVAGIYTGGRSIAKR